MFAPGFLRTEWSLGRLVILNIEGRDVAPRIPDCYVWSVNRYLSNSGKSLWSRGESCSVVDASCRDLVSGGCFRH